MTAPAHRGHEIARNGNIMRILFKIQEIARHVNIPVQVWSCKLDGPFFLEPLLKSLLSLVRYRASEVVGDIKFCLVSIRTYSATFLNLG